MKKLVLWELVNTVQTWGTCEEHVNKVLQILVMQPPTQPTDFISSRASQPVTQPQVPCATLAHTLATCEAGDFSKQLVAEVLGGGGEKIQAVPGNWGGGGKGDPPAA